MVPACAPTPTHSIHYASKLIRAMSSNPKTTKAGETTLAVCEGTSGVEGASRIRTGAHRHRRSTFSVVLFNLLQ